MPALPTESILLRMRLAAALSFSARDESNPRKCLTQAIRAQAAAASFLESSSEEVHESWEIQCSCAAAVAAKGPVPESTDTPTTAPPTPFKDCERLSPA